MHKVSLMTQTPTTCLVCGRGNTPDDPHTMDDFFAIDLERDVNWGDSTYICRYCCDTLAALAGFVTQEQLQEQMNINEGLNRRVHDLHAAVQSRERRLEAIAGGARALKSEKKRQAKKKATAS